MLVAVVVLAVVAVSLLVAVVVTRSRLAAERERVAAASAAAKRQDEELTTTNEALTSARDALAAETTAHAADTERLEQLQLDLGRVEQRAAEAEQRARDAASASGVEPGVVWPLELRRSERTWRFSVSPGPHATSPLAATDAPLMAALKVEVDAARNDIGAEVELAADLPPGLEAATEVLVLRVAQELLADVVRRSDRSTLRVFIDDDDIVVSVDATDRDGEPVSPEPLPIESPMIQPIADGVRLTGCAPPAEADGDGSDHDDDAH